jgi:hypothetical protein
MRQIIHIPLEQIRPDPGGVFQSQGMPPGTSPSQRVKGLYDSAAGLFPRLAAPTGVMADISIEAFGDVYSGPGKNEADTPLEHIFPRAQRLALLAFTLGEKISREIQQQLDNKNLALGYMLDTVASYCADKAAQAVQLLFRRQLLEAGSAEESSQVLLYSPGYCGWHISGQKTLFEYLKPEEAGIHLNERFLMVPLKSVSGVLVAGKPAIHRFTNNYPFCTHCPTRNCRERIKGISTG